MQTNSYPLITVVIPTKDRLSLLKVALQSVYDQTYQHLEIIIVDVCSTDGTAQFLQEQAATKGIKVSRSEVPVKAGAARNLGIKAATGDLIAFLDDDDEWMPTKLQKQIPLFNNPQVALVYTGVEFVNVDQNITYNVLPTLTGRVFDQLLVENKIGTTNTVVIRSATAKALLFDESLPAREEYDLWIRVAKQHEIAGVSEPLARVYSRNSLSRISSDVNNYAEAIDAMDAKFRDDVATLPAAQQAKRRAGQFFFLAAQAVKANNVTLARSYYLKSIASKFSIKAAGSYIASFFGIKALLLMRKLKG